MAASGQQRQAAGVIEVPVREQYGIELLFRAGGRAVERLGFLAAWNRPQSTRMLACLV